MEDEEALELYNFFVSEGYDVGDKNDFTSALEDDSKRVELHTFFETEGYDVGDVDDFILKKKEDTESVSANGSSDSPSVDWRKNLEGGKRIIEEKIKQADGSTAKEKYERMQAEGKRLQAEGKEEEVQELFSPPPTEEKPTEYALPTPAEPQVKKEDEYHAYMSKQGKEKPTKPSALPTQLETIQEIYKGESPQEIINTFDEMSRGRTLEETGGRGLGVRPSILREDSMEGIPFDLVPEDASNWTDQQWKDYKNKLIEEGKIEDDRYGSANIWVGHEEDKINIWGEDKDSFKDNVYSFVTEGLIDGEGAPSGNIEESVVLKMNEIFGEHGFEFEEWDRSVAGKKIDLEDAMMVYKVDRFGVRSKNKILIDLDTWNSDAEEAKKLQNFLLAHRPKKESPKDEFTKKRFTTKEELNTELKKFNTLTKSFETTTASVQKNTALLNQKVELLKQMSDDNPNKAKLKEEIKHEWNEVDAQVKRWEWLRKEYSHMGGMLDRAAGELFAFETLPTGSFTGATWNTIVKGASDIATGTVGVALDMYANEMDLTNAEKNILKTGEGTTIDYANRFSQAATLVDAKEDKGVLGTMRKNVVLDAIMASNTKQEYIDKLQGSNPIAMGYFGVLGSAPAMAFSLINPALGVVAFTAQSIEHQDRQMSEDPAFDDMTEEEKDQFKYPMAAMIGILESIGFRNVTSRSPMFKNILGRALGKTTKDMSAKTFKEILHTEINNGLKRYGAEAFSAGLAEAETEALQTLSEQIGHMAFNKAHGVEAFKTPENYKEALFEIGESAIAGFVGGQLMDGVGRISNVVKKTSVGPGGKLKVKGGFKEALGVESRVEEKYDFSELSDTEWALFQFTKNNSQYTDLMKEKLQVEVVNGKLTAEEARRDLEIYQQVAQTSNKIPTHLPISHKKESLGLLLQKKELQEEIKDKDPALSKSLKEQVKTIDEKLQNLGDLDQVIQVMSGDYTIYSAPEGAVYDEKTKTYKGGNNTTIQASTVTREKMIEKINNLKTKEDIVMSGLYVKNDPELVTMLNKKTAEINDKDGVANRFSYQPMVSSENEGATGIGIYFRNNFNQAQGVGEDTRTAIQKSSKRFKDTGEVDAEAIIYIAEKINKEGVESLTKEERDMARKHMDNTFKLNIEIQSYQPKREGVNVAEKEQRLNSLDERMNNAELINEKEISEAADELYDDLIELDERTDVTPEAKKRIQEKIESEIRKLEGYEFETETKVGTTTEKTTVKGTRKVGTKTKNQNIKTTSVPKAEGLKVRFTGKGYKQEGDQGVLRKETRADGKDMYVIEYASGATTLINEDMGSPEINYDADGNPESVTLKDKSGNTMVVEDADFALDEAIIKRENEIGAVEETILDEVLEEVTKEVTTATEIIKTKTKEDAVQEQGAGKVDADKSATDASKMETRESTTKSKELTGEELQDKTDDTKQKQSELDSLFDEVVGDKKTPTETITINNKGNKRLSRTVKKVIKQAENAVASLKEIAPNVKIVLHATPAEYNATVPKAIPGERGAFNPRTNTIHVNLLNVAAATKKNTVGHEVFHAILFNKFGKESLIQAFSKEMLEGLKKASKKGSQMEAKLEAYLLQYADKGQHNEEKLAEIFGDLATNYESLDVRSQNILIKLIEKLAALLGGKEYQGDFTADEASMVKLMNNLASKVATGTEITEADLNIKEQEELLEQEEQGGEGEVGTIKVKAQLKEIINTPNPQDDARSWIRKLVEPLEVKDLNGENFITNMYDYTNAGETDLGNGYTINLLGGRNYVPIIMYKLNKKLGDVSNLAAFNTQGQADGFIRNAIKGKANMFAPHSGTLDGSWQFQQHIFEELVDLVLDKQILSNKKLIDAFNSGLKSKAGQQALATFNKNNKSKLKNLNSFKTNPKELVKLLDINNNYSPDLRKILNQKIASDKTFQKAIGVKNLNQFHQRIMDPLNKGVVGGEIMTFVQFDPTTFEVAKTNPNDVDHHPSFGWVVKAKIEKIYQPNKFYKSYNLTDTYTKYNTDETVTSRKTDKGFAESNVLSSAGAIPKVAQIKRQLGEVKEANLAPNGEVSNLNPEQYKLVRTPAFKKWFGDWETDPENASKVLDENGEPKVVYRGRHTKEGDFGDIIDISKTEEGAFFADNQRSADLFMSDFRKIKKGDYEVIPVFLNLRNPEMFTDFWRDFIYKGRIMDGVTETWSPKKGVDGAIIGDDIWLDDIDWKEGQVDEFGNEIDEEYIIIGEGKQYIAIDSKQIKLADGSNVTFDPKEPSIKRQLGEVKEEAIVAVAPYFDTTIKNVEEAKKLREQESYKQYIKNLKGIGEQLGIEVEIEEGIGGYKNEAGNEIIEISNKVILKDSTLEQAEEYAALVAALAPETQESSIAAQYIKTGSKEHNGNEYIIKVDNIEQALNALNTAGITDFSINETTNEVSFIDIFDFKDAELEQKIGNFVNELENNNVNYEEESYRPVNSQYVDKGKRKEILRKVAEKRSTLRQARSDFYNSLLQAIENDARFQGISAEEYFPGIKKLQQEVREAPPIKRQLGETNKIDSFVLQAKAKGYSDSAIKLLLESKGVTTTVIDRIFKGKVKKAPSAAKVIGKPKPKKITIQVNTALKEKLRAIARETKNVKRAVNSIRKEIQAEIKQITKGRKASLSPATLKNITSKINNANLFTKEGVLNMDAVIDVMVYVDEQLNKAEKKVRRSVLNKRRKNALKNINRGKLGIPKVVTRQMERLFAVEASLIPDSVLNEYTNLVSKIGEKKSVVSLDEISSVEKTVDKILDEIERETSRISTYAMLLEMDMWDSNEYNDDGTLNYKKTVDNLVNQGHLNEKQRKEMMKYKKEILPPPAPKTKEEIALKEEEQQIEKEILEEEIKDSEINSEKLTTRDERKLAKTLNNLIKSDGIKELDNLDLKRLQQVIDNINNGWLPHLAQVMVYKINAANKSKVTNKAVKTSKPFSSIVSAKKIRATINKSFSKRKNNIYQLISTGSLNYIDLLLGNSKGKPIFENIFEDSAKSYSNMETDQTLVDKKLDEALNKIMRKYKFNPNSIKRSQTVLMTYLLQREFESNPGRKGEVYSAASYLKDTMEFYKGKSELSDKREAEMLEEVLEKYSNSDGEIEAKTIYKSLNRAERNAIKVIDEVNTELTEKAEYTAGVIQGQIIKPIVNYIHHWTQQSDKDFKEDNKQFNDYIRGTSVSTKAKTIETREVGSRALNFDPFGATKRGSRMTLLDYHMTPVIRETNMTLTKMKEELKGESREVREIFNGVEMAYKQVVEDVVGRGLNTSSVGDEILTYLAKTGYRTMLAGVPRMALETGTNLINAAMINPQGFGKGVKILTDLSSADQATIIRVLNSKQQQRLYGDPLTGRMIEPGLIQSNMGVRNKKVRTEVDNRAKQISTYLSLGRKGVEKLADTMISAPDKAVMRPLWYGTLAREFKKLTGKDIDFKKIEQNDEAYMNANKEALQEATKIADRDSFFSGATDNPFMGILKNVKRQDDGPGKKIYKNVDRFMLRFLLVEYENARLGINALVRGGEISRVKGAQILAATTTRMILYSSFVGVMGNIYADLMRRMFGIDIEDEEEEKDVGKLVGQGAVSTVNTLLFGRSYGQVVRGIINNPYVGTEYFNEKYGQSLREGEYDPYKDAIGFSPYTKPTEKEKVEGRDPFKEISKLAGPYSIIAKLTGKLIKESGKEVSEKKKIGEVDLYFTEVDVTPQRLLIGLQALGMLNLVPFFKDVNKAAQKEVYKEYNKANKVSGGKKKGGKSPFKGGEIKGGEFKNIEF